MRSLSDNISKQGNGPSQHISTLIDESTLESTSPFDVMNDDDTFPLTSTFGASIEINDSLRHSIQREIESIETSISTLNSDINIERKSKMNIEKELARATNEMAERRRCCGDVLEEEVLRESVRRGWREIVERELLQLATPDVSMEEEDPYGCEIEENDSIGDAKDVTLKKCRREKHPLKFIKHHKSRLKSKIKSISSLQSTIESTTQKISMLENEASGVNKQLEALENSKSEVELSVERKRKEYEMEMNKRARLKDAVAKARKNGGEFAKLIVEKTTEEITQRSRNSIKESSFSSGIDASQHDVKLIQDEELELDSKLNLLCGFLDSYSEQCTEIESELVKYRNIETELEEVKKDILGFISTDEDLSKKEEDSTNEYESAKISFEKASAIVKEFEAEKAATDAAEIEVLQPALVKKAEASKEREKLALEVAALHKVIMAQQNEYIAADANLDEKIAEKCNELMVAKNKVQLATSALDERKKIAASEEAQQSKELKEINDLSTKVEAATEVEIVRLESMKRQKTEERLEKLDLRRSELASLEDALMEEIKHLKDALAFMDEKKRVENTIRKSEIKLSDDGNDASPAIFLL